MRKYYISFILIKSNINSYLILILNIYITNLENIIVFKSNLEKINYLTT